MSQSKVTLFGLPPRDLDHVLRLAADDLAALRGKALFLTGGTGFFGKWLVASLLHANVVLDLEFDLCVLSRNPDAFTAKYPELGRETALRFLAGDVGDFTTDEWDFDFIVHAATDTTTFTNDTDERIRSRTIVDGTNRVLDLARSGRVTRLLNISSGAVYGAFAAQPIGAREDDFAQAKAVTPYGEAKREAEQLCVDSGLDFVTARAFAFVGPHLPLDAHFAAGNFLRDAIRGGPIMVRGDGTALRSYLHPADLVVWLLRLLIRGQRGHAYNVGSDEAVTTAQLARAIADAVSPKPEVIIQSAQPQGPQNIYLPNISRARTELCLGVAIPLRDAIARTLQIALGD